MKPGGLPFAEPRCKGHQEWFADVPLPMFEREARSMCDEYGLEPTPEQVARFAMHLANRHYRAEVAPLYRMLVRMEACQPTRAVRHADGEVTLLPRAIGPTEQLLHEHIEQARARAFGPGLAPPVSEVTRVK
jgi:hypothetical protein